MAAIMSVNVGHARPTAHSTAGQTAIDKRPADGPVQVRPPGSDVSGSGVAGDEVCDTRFHGGPDRAVYAYAREDLDHWAAELGRPLRNGIFGENLTTVGLDVNDALIGERWRIGPAVVLEVTMPRIPCRTFAAWLGERGWLRTFMQHRRPGAMLRVLRPGEVRQNDAISTVHRPDHGITVGFAFLAATTRPELLPRLLAADGLSGELRRRAAQSRSRAWNGQDAGSVPSVSGRKY